VPRALLIPRHAALVQGNGIAFSLFLKGDIAVTVSHHGKARAVAFLRARKRQPDVGVEGKMLHELA